MDERKQQVAKEIQSIHGLTREDRHAILSLDLPIYDSLVVAHLRLARHLLVQDLHFDWKTREETWHTWRKNIIDALEGALRYRHNDTLIVAVGVCIALFPALHQGAGLMAYKMLDDVL